MTTIQSNIPEVCKAFAPLVQRFTYAATDAPLTEQEVTIDEFIDNREDQYHAVATLRAEYFNRTATFHYEQVISKLFRDERTLVAIEKVDIPGCYLDHNLVAYVRLPYSISGATLVKLPHVMVNAAAQMGELLEMPHSQFLTTFQRIRRYEGFPLAVSFISENDGFPHLDGDVPLDEHRNSPWSDIDVRHITMHDIHANHGIAITDTYDDPYLRDTHGDIITTHLGDPILIDNPPEVYDQRTILLTPAPAHPFYVRWINQQGGYDHWMFACRQFFKRELKSASYFRPYRDTNDTGTDAVLLGKEAEENISVSSGSIDANEWQAISRILYSPKIELYNPATKLWHTILLDKGSAEIGTAAPTGEVTLTFNLPAPRLQF